tara:strand:- start:65 stop:622 length:558 start_codon:yes stop_codon:yes gene_type:complete
MRTALFEIPLFLYDVQDWERKKTEIISWFDKTTMSRSSADHFNSDKNISKNKFYAQDYADLLENEFKFFQDEIRQLRAISHRPFSSITLDHIWFVEYEKGDYQLPHNHRSSGFSGILYVDFNEEKHPLTTVIQPWNGIFDDETKMINVDAEEGTLIIMPSNLLHFSLPNKSDHKKIVLSFDLTII